MRAWILSTILRLLLLFEFSVDLVKCNIALKPLNLNIGGQIQLWESNAEESQQTVSSCSSNLLLVGSQQHKLKYYLTFCLLFLVTKPLSEISEWDDGLLLHWYPLCILYLQVDEVELLYNFPNRNQANCDDKICSKIKALLIFKTTFQIRFYGTIESEMFWRFRGWVWNVSQVEWEQLTSPWYKYWSAIILFFCKTATAVLNDGNNYSGKRGNKSDIVSGFTSIYNWIAPQLLYTTTANLRSTNL